MAVLERTREIRMVDYISVARVIVAGILLCAIAYGLRVVWRGIRG